MALAKAIKTHMNIVLEKKPRMLVKAYCNLNDLETPLFSKYKLAPKKMNSKFHIHIPNLKINQLRVELDNITSDFENSNNKLKAIICHHKLFTEVNDFIYSAIKPYIYSSHIFQEKNCNIVNETNKTHYSPEALLDLIANKIKELNIKDDKIEISELDIIFKYAKKNSYSLEIIYALYILNTVLEYLVN